MLGFAISTETRERCAKGVCGGARNASRDGVRARQAAAERMTLQSN